MLDQYGRNITYLRISITDRCNLRCKYCMPDGVTDVGMKNILTFEEIWEIVRAGVSLGITHVRITGGEPLVRKGCVDLIRGIRAIPGVETITMTTNGVLLRTYAASLKEAGLDGLNVSLDTLDFEEFASLAGRQNLKEVLDGIQAAKEMGLPVKINAVNRKELNPISLVLYAQQQKIPLRFIEIMPVGYGKQYVGRSNDELRTCLEDEFGKSEMITYQANQKKQISEQISHMVQTLHTKEVPIGSGPAVYYRFSELTIPVGFISAIHGKFCESCNRVRLTAQGYLKLCLCYDKGIDLRQILRGEETGQTKVGVIKGICISEKRGTAKHEIEEAVFVKDWGIEKDAHAGHWHRQVSLLSYEKIEEFRKKGAQIGLGAFGENLIVEGYDFRNLPVGTRFQCGDVILEMTQIGKECHSHCEIYKRMGECIMPREGVFAVVIQGGKIKKGDILEKIEETEAHID